MRDMLKHNFDIETTQVSHDIMERDDSTLPHVGLYTAGPPCQSFSGEGTNAGLLDPHGVVLLRVLQFICRKQPTTFIIENILGLNARHKSTCSFLINTCATRQGQERLYKIQGWRSRVELALHRRGPTEPPSCLHSRLGSRCGGARVCASKAHHCNSFTPMSRSQNGGRAP